MRDTFTVSIQQLDPVLGDLPGNCAMAEAACRSARADLVVFPELFLSGAPLWDLARRHGFAEQAMTEVEALAAALADGPAVAIGTPWLEEGRLTNACAILQNGRVDKVRHKVEVGAGPFDESRAFASADMPGPVDIAGVRIGLPIGEDLLGADVVECLAETGAEILIAPVASPYTPYEADRRLNIAVARVVESELPLVVVNAVGGRDEYVFDGASFALGADRRLTHQLPAFTSTSARLVFRRSYDGWTLEPGERIALPDGEAAIWSASVLGLRDLVRLKRADRIVLALEDDVESAVAAAISVDAVGADRVEAVAFDETGVAAPFGLACRRLALPSGDFGAADAAVLRRGMADAVLEAVGTGGLIVRSASSSTVALGAGPVGRGVNPMAELCRSEVKALARWRNATRPDGAQGPEGPVVAAALIEAPCGLEGAPANDDLLDRILTELLDGDASVDELVKDGYEARSVRWVAERVADGEVMRRRSTPRLRLAPRPAGDRRYPITNRYRDA
ncbi:nitrilase-related carbon-nitrogen hydrolase [Acuticoccus sediminis]|uniref:nitrilase-related carbon-nitrogen hydrolase n=1 Tax=Acuticoccus sediminis TaxID=2184697 RepID=UPI001CFD44DB|nr:nitrilase-related carbon-nitrogen hydrolase [Acuticoccus sediminis]